MVLHANLYHADSLPSRKYLTRNADRPIALCAVLFLSAFQPENNSI
jgi:hypothetical protein